MLLVHQQCPNESLKTWETQGTWIYPLGIRCMPNNLRETFQFWKCYLQINIDKASCFRKINKWRNCFYKALITTWIKPNYRYNRQEIIRLDKTRHSFFILSENQVVMNPFRFNVKKSNENHVVPWYRQTVPWHRPGKRSHYLFFVQHMENGYEGRP